MSASFQLAVPTHRRAALLERVTLPALLRLRERRDCVTLFLSDEEDKTEYSHLGFPMVVVGAGATLTEKFNVIHRHYPPGTQVAVMEDDVTLVGGKGGENVLSEADLETVILRGFSELPAAGGLWGIEPHANGFYFSGKVTRTLKLVVAHLFGFIASRERFLEVTAPTKTDYERTARYWLMYGEVVRLGMYGVKTKSYTQSGGLQAVWDKGSRAAAEDAACRQLVRRFPSLLARKDKKTSPFAELRFLRGNLDPAARAEAIARATGV